ncbi:MAG: GNAT family N-acetyltransferase [Candidatus Thorarchaeota archaeon]
MRAPEKLETKRLILKPFIKEDNNEFMNFMKTEKENINIDLRSDLQILNDPKALFTLFLNINKKTLPILVFVILDKENDTFLGTCGLFSVKNNKSVQCFFALLKQFRKNGFAIEAMLKLFEYAFITLEIPKIVAYIHPSSSPSWKVAERIGMKYMGHIQPKNIKSKVMFFSIEKKEYKTQRSY